MQVVCKNECTISFILDSALYNFSQNVFEVEYEEGPVPKINFINHMSKAKTVDTFYDRVADMTTLSVSLGLLHGAQLSIVLKGNLFNLVAGLKIPHLIARNEGYCANALISQNYTPSLGVYQIGSDGEFFIDNKNYRPPVGALNTNARSSPIVAWELISISNSRL